MSELSPRLGLPFLMAAQAQKHITHNEALLRLDQVTQLVLQALDATEPPAEPAEGQVWALGPAPTGAWAGRGGDLALWFDGAWHFVTPAPGWQASFGTALCVFDGSAWVAPDLPALQNLPGMGINASHDTTNRLTVAAEATLLTHEGAGHQLKLNKAAAADTASLLFQTGFSGRAEMGTAGSDNFEIKVSSDGAAWFDALVANRNSGLVNLPNGLSVTGTVTLSAPLSLANGGTGASTASAARSNLGLGTAATHAVQTSPGDLSPGRIVRRFSGDGVFGWGLAGDESLRVENSVGSIRTSGLYRWSDNTGGAPTGAGVNMHISRLAGEGVGRHLQLGLSHSGQKVFFRAMLPDGSWEPWLYFRHTANTTVDANGFVKEASPIVRLFADGTEEPVQHIGAQFERLGIGQYRLSGVEPLAATGWQIEVPQDHNGNRLVFVETAYDALARVLSVTTTAPEWSNAAHAWVAGEARDIPEGRWVDLRFSPGQTLDTAGEGDGP